MGLFGKLFAPRRPGRSGYGGRHRGDTLVPIRTRTRPRLKTRQQLAARKPQIPILTSKTANKLWWR